jgi:hypothetical protein
MHIDVVGRVQNTRLPARHGLLPVFEAVVNSIAAIEEAARPDGLVRVSIGRDLRQSTLDVHGNTIADVEGFEIEDNGLGFTDENFESFETMDSRAKSYRGGKGIGRLLWLKAFDHAEVTSTYYEAGAWKRRSFDFRLSTAGIDNAQLQDVPEQPHGGYRTSVKLVGFRSPYRDSAPKSAEAIARRVIEHCLEYFLLGTRPRIVVEDPANGIAIELQTLFADEYHPEAGSRSFKVADASLSITDMLLKATGDAQHAIHFCAHNRVVQTVPLAGRIPHLDGHLMNRDGEAVVYSGYVTGDFLNERVEPERSAFDVDRDSDLALKGGPTWEQLTRATIESIAEYLNPRTAELRDQSLQRIRAFAETQEPKYRPLLSHRTAQIETLSGTLSDSQLDVELHKILNDWRNEVRREAQAQLNQVDASPSGFDVHREQFRRVLGQLQEVTKSDLAEYVVHRATVLSFFERLLGKQPDDAFAKEDALHGLVFPLRKDSEQVDYDEHSLWILDERLAYHHFLASDVPFEQQRAPVEVKGKDRPDLLIYNNPLAFAPGSDSYASIVIVEFKRPERTAVADENSPIRQVLRYVAQIRDGRARRRDGSTVEVPRNLPFYCYVVATLTPQLKAEAKEMNFTETPDGRGYFKFNPNFNAYIELSSYRKVLEDAKKRNQAFFDRLQIRVS